MCQETVITYELCRHEDVERRHCRAAQHEIDKAQKRATWCCFTSTTPARKIVCQVKYQTHKDYSYCPHCKTLRKREQDRQVQAAQDEARRKAKADRDARYRKVLDTLAQNEARHKASKATPVQRYDWQKVTPVERRGYAAAAPAAQNRHGDSFIENPLYAEVLNLLTETEYREFMPPPDSTASRTGTGSGSGRQQPSRNQSQPVRDTGRVREQQHSRSRSQPQTQVQPPAPLSTRRVQELPAHRQPGRATASIPSSVGRARPQVQEGARQGRMAGPQRQATPNGGARPPRIVQDGGYPVVTRKPIPLRKDVQNDYGEPMPDDDFLDFVESSWK